jgi:hypothetical protein
LGPASSNISEIQKCAKMPQAGDGSHRTCTLKLDVVARTQRELYLSRRERSARSAG